MGCRLAILGSPHVQRGGAIKFDLRPFQIANLNGPQPVPVGHEDQSRVTMPIAAIRFVVVIGALYPDMLREMIQDRTKRPQIGSTLVGAGCVSLGTAPMDDDETHLHVTYASHWDMDDAFCARMRMAIEAGLESAPIGVVTTPGTKKPKYVPTEPRLLGFSLVDMDV